MSLKVDGRTLQSGSTRNMLFDVADLVAYLSTLQVLEPGDIIATGTPAGVAALHTPPAWLKPGSTVEVEVEGLGRLHNPIIEGPALMPDKPIVLLTNAMHPDGEAILAPHVKMIVPPDARPETLRQWAGDADGIIVRAKLPDDIVDHAPRLKAIVRHGVGLDFIPVAAATARGIAVANLPGSNTNAVAEYVHVGAAASAPAALPPGHKACAATAGMPRARRRTDLPSSARQRSASSASARSAAIWQAWRVTASG